jgi:hypothetical protein
MTVCSPGLPHTEAHNLQNPQLKGNCKEVVVHAAYIQDNKILKFKNLFYKIIKMYN